MRVVALDVGERRIGVAISDPTGFLATPLAVIHRVGDDKDVAAIIDLARSHEAERILVGIPISLDGVIREHGQRVQHFSRKLAERSGLPVVEWDERLSTVEADRMLAEQGTTARQRRERIDAAAAAVMLQAFLDAQRFQTGGRPSYE